MRRTLLVLLAAVVLASCQVVPKGPSETGQPVYYDPQRGISSDGSVYRRP